MSDPVGDATRRMIADIEEALLASADVIYGYVTGESPPPRSWSPPAPVRPAPRSHRSLIGQTKLRVSPWVPAAVAVIAVIVVWQWNR